MAAPSIPDVQAIRIAPVSRESVARAAGAFGGSEPPPARTSRPLVGIGGR